MSWSGGVFTRFEGTTGCVDKEAAGTGITAILEDQRFNEFATGINTCITKDGQNSASANLPMGGFKHTNVAVASAATDYARADQVQNNSLRYISTVGGTANAITLTPSPAISAYAAGQKFAFIATSNNTAATTVNISGVGAKNIFHSAVSSALLGGEIITGQIIEIEYDGTQFRLMSPSSPAFNKVTSTTTVSNTVTETTIYSYAIPANTFAPFKALRLTLFGILLNNTGSDRGVTFRIKSGATTLATFLYSTVTSNAIATGADRACWTITETIFGLGASSQVASGECLITSTTNSTGGAAGFGAGYHQYSCHNGLTFNSASSNTLVVTAELSTASASLELSILSGMLEVL